MAQYRIPHPFDAGYALPDHVMAEPPGRHTLTSAQRPRRSFDAPGYIPPAWSAHFALPKYVQAEPLGRGAAVTHQARRKTISMRVPGALGALDIKSLGVTARLAPQQDPFRLYGQRLAEMILGTLNTVPKDLHKIALETTLDELEPGLHSRVNIQAQRYEKRGMSPREALKAAIASSTSEGLAKEVIRVGKSGKLPAKKSLAGLGFYVEAYPEALAGFGSSLKRAAQKTGRAIKRGAKAVARAPKKGVLFVGNKMTSAGRTVYRYGKKVLDKAKKLACTVMNNPLSDAAAGTAAAAYGAPPQTGTMGKQIVQAGLCPAKAQALPDTALTTPEGLTRMPGWVLPVGIGAAGLVTILLLKD